MLRLIYECFSISSDAFLLKSVFPAITAVFVGVRMKVFPVGSVS